MRYMSKLKRGSTSNEYVMPKIAYLVNAPSTTGVGYQAASVKKALQRVAPQYELIEYMIDGVDGILCEDGQTLATIRQWPGLLGSKSVAWIRLGKKWLATSRLRHLDVIHATNQALSFLGRNVYPSVVTVHDLIELIDPQSKAAYLLNRYLYSGIPYADRIIAVSQYTARTIHEYYHIPQDRISVIYNGVGEEFHPIQGLRDTIAYQMLRHELSVPVGNRVVLYVGSDHPRKNVITAVRAFTQARRKLPLMIFIKVGEPGLPAGRKLLLEEIDRLQVRDSVRFIGAVTSERLNELYNLADVFIYPSRLEGFGLPPLQAMAAGTPVITSNATSLPEVVGDAALLHDPNDVDGFVADLLRVLEDCALSDNLRQEGFARAQQFSWTRAATEVANVYESL